MTSVLTNGACLQIHSVWAKARLLRNSPGPRAADTTAAPGRQAAVVQPVGGPDPALAFASTLKPFSSGGEKPLALCWTFARLFCRSPGSKLSDGHPGRRHELAGPDRSFRAIARRRLGHHDGQVAMAAPPAMSICCCTRSSAGTTRCKPFHTLHLFQGLRDRPKRVLGKRLGLRLPRCRLTRRGKRRAGIGRKVLNWPRGRPGPRRPGPLPAPPAPRRATRSCG